LRESSISVCTYRNSLVADGITNNALPDWDELVFLKCNNLFKYGDNTTLILSCSVKMHTPLSSKRKRDVSFIGFELRMALLFKINSLIASIIDFGVGQKLKG